MKNKKIIFSTFSLVSLLSSNAFALNPIVRSFSSVRAEGMGDVRYTTGLFEENFYANPARITANGENRFQLPQFTFEAGSGALSAAGDMTKGGNELEKFANSVGRPLTAKFQMVFPGFYKNNFITDKWSFGIDFMFGAETHSEVSQTGAIDPSTMFNAGPAITLARRLLEEDRLTIGATMHADFRASINQNISVVDYFNGVKVNGNTLGGNGLGLDFDLGTRFLPHWTFLGAQYELGFAINNILGGYYNNLGHPIHDWQGNPTPSYRSYNLGVSGTKKNIWILDQVLLALEFTDIGNNPNGSLFRTIHLGTEAKWKVLKARMGVNQGYLCAGFGVDIGFFDLNFATYGEEMGLNAGDMEDRRYAIELGFQI